MGRKGLFQLICPDHGSTGKEVRAGTGGRKLPAPRRELKQTWRTPLTVFSLMFVQPAVLSGPGPLALFQITNTQTFSSFGTPNTNLYVAVQTSM